MLAAVLLPSAASAQVVAERPQLREPRLAGDVVLADDGRRLLAFGPGGGAVLAERRPDAGALLVDADAAQVVAARRDALLAGGPLGPLGVVEACPEPSGGAPPVPAVDGAVVAWTACRPDAIRVRDGASVAELPAGGAVSALAVRGRRVAWVADGVLHRRALDLPDEEPAVALGGPVAGLVLGEDGTAIVAVGAAPAGCRDVPLLAVAPGAPTTVDLGLRACALVAYAGGRLVGLRRLRATPSALQLVATGFDGPLRGLGTVSGADWDGRRLAVTRAGCAADELVVQDGLVALDPVVCARPAVAGDAILRRDGRLRVTVACPDGCRDLTVVVAGRAVPLIASLVGEREVRVAISRRGRGLLRRRRRAVVELLRAGEDRRPRRVAVRVRVP